MNINELRLEDLIPLPTSFKLKQFKEFEFMLRPCTGGMLVDMAHNIGNIETLLGNPGVENISKIALFLMEYESACKFKKQQVKVIDLEGNEKDIEIGGYKLLMQTIQGIEEQYSIYGAILLSLGYKKEKADTLIKKIKDGFNQLVNDRVEESSKKKTIKKQSHG